MKTMLCLCLLIAQVAVAQSSDSSQSDSLPGKTNYKFGLTSEFGINYALSSLPQFATFARANRVTFPNTRLGVNFTGATGFRLNRFRIQLLQTFSIVGIYDGNLSKPNAWVSRLQGGANIGGTVGYDVLNDRNRRLYVIGGFGGLGFDFAFYRQSNQAIPFNTVFQATPNSVPSLSIRNDYVELALEYAQREKRKRTANNVFRVGYRMGTGKSAWRSDANTFTAPILERVNQFYLQYAVALSTNWNRGDRPSARLHQP
jgi:hypothetical protein